MTIQEIKIKVDIPDGWDVVEYREVRPNEFRLMANGKAEAWDQHMPSIGHCFILRKTWQPPAWLRATECKCVWRFHGKWYASIERPVKGDLHWEINFPNLLMNGHILTHFTEPCGLEVPELKTLRTWE